MKLKGGMLDADGHLIERDEELLEYMEAPYKGNNTLLGFPFFPTLDGYHRGAIMARLGIHKGYTINAKTWLEFLDGTGIESTVLYPTAGLAFSMIQDPTWAVPLARAYNNWFTDKFHRVSPQRLRAVALVPIQDVAEAVKELRRAVTELGMVGAVIGANGAELGTRKPLGDPSFWPLYEEAERLDVPVALHGAPSASLGINFFHRFAQTHALEHPIAQIIQLTSMVMEGVFERFPKLRVAYLEAGITAEENATYHLHPATMGLFYARAHPARQRWRVRLRWSRMYCVSWYAPMRHHPSRKQGICQPRSQSGRSARRANRCFDDHAKSECWPSRLNRQCPTCDY
jgi:predicted TIM-barrel fold metal-dependent hydrolase